MSSHRFDLHDPSASDSFSFLFFRPGWPYVLGAIAGPMFGISMLIFLAAAHTHGNGGEAAALLAILGSTLASLFLGIAWFGVLRGGQGGAGPLVGSCALPLAIGYLYLDRGSYDLNTAGALIVGALAAFGWGHVAAPGGAVLRGCAAGSAVLWSLLFVAVVRRWDMPTGLVGISFVALSLAALCLAFSFPRLQYAPPRDAPHRW
jgi:hypothetical protein